MEEAAILGTLIYKHNYWSDENKLTTNGIFEGFYISHSDIREETCLGTSVVKKAIKKLENEGLIKSKRQGLGKPNLYCIDEAVINQYIEDHKDDYERWRKILRVQIVSVSPVNNKKDENRPSRESKIDVLDSSISTTTKNKITKTKKLKTITNHINVAMEIEVSFEDLSTKISELQESKFEDRPELFKEFYWFLIDSVPMFENFKASDKD